MTSSAQDVVARLHQSFDEKQQHEQPYRHWFLSSCLPETLLDNIIALPLKVPDLGDVSGKRELHNSTRTYFDVENQEKHDCCAAFAQGFQDEQITSRIERDFDIDLSGTYLRIEYAQDTGKFWLEPHSDLGVKSFTMLIYLSKDPGHAELGTDIYDAEKRQVGRSPFTPGGALVFVPASDTFHGFEPRTIEGVRKSIIVNYVTSEWRAREQLAFPDSAIS